MSNGEEPDPLPQKFWVQTVTIGDGSDEDPRRPKLDFGGEPWKWSGFGEVQADNRICHVQTTDAGRTNVLADPDVIEIPDPTQATAFTAAERDVAEILADRWGWEIPANIQIKTLFFLWLLGQVIPGGLKGRPESYFRSR